MPVLVLPGLVINTKQPEGPQKRDIIRVCCQCATETIGHLDWCDTKIGHVPGYRQKIWCLHEPCDEDTMAWSKTRGQKVRDEHPEHFKQASEKAENGGTTPKTGSPSGSPTPPQSSLFSASDSTSSNSQQDQDPSGTDSKTDKTPDTSLAKPEPAAPQTTGFLPLQSTDGSHGSTEVSGTSAGQLDDPHAESFLRLVPHVGARAQIEQQTTHDENTSKDEPATQGKSSTLSDLFDFLSLRDGQNKSSESPRPADMAAPDGGPANVDNLPDLSNSVSTLSANQTPSTPKKELEPAVDAVATTSQPAGPVLDLPKTSGPSKASLKTTPVNQEHQRHQHHHKKPKSKGPPGNMFGPLGNDDDDDDEEEEA